MYKEYTFFNRISSLTCIAIAVLTILLPLKSYAQVKFVNEFLNIGVGARAHGMFGSVVASGTDATSAYWNAANLSNIKAPLQLNAMHANWFGGVANYDYFTIAKRLGNKNTVVGLSMIRLGVDNIPNTLNLVGADGSIDFDRVTLFSASDYGFLASLGTKKTENLSIGGSIKVIRRTIGQFGSSWGFGADLGMTYRLGHLTLAVNARDITTTFNAWTFNLNDEEKAKFLATGNDVPLSSTEITLPRLIPAVAYSGNASSFSYLAELNVNLSSDGSKSSLVGANRFNIDPTFGVEIGYAKKVYLRGGLGNIQRVLNASTDSQNIDIQPNVGLGLSLGRIKIDYALSNVGNISGVLASHIFSVSLDFKERESKQ